MLNRRPSKRAKAGAGLAKVVRNRPARYHDRPEGKRRQEDKEFEVLRSEEART